MFYEGDLQSGIALAVQEAKQVLCFVRDDGEESTQWENEYLVDEEIARLLATNSVALRLTAGSQEAGFLASFCPINTIPTLISIKNGVLQEYIVSGTTKDELKRRLKAVLSPVPQSHPQQTPQTSDTPPTATYQTPIATSETLDSNISVPNPEPDEEAIATETVRRENIREGKKRAVTPEPAQTPKSVKDNQKVWRQQQLNRERKEREERERVLALIRQDREDRKARTERQKPSPILQGDSHNSEQPSQTPKSMFKVSEYRLQVRLFDGSSLRSNFAPTHTIRDDVRRWIDGQRSDGHTPYNLKQILTPLPNRTISISEENQPLGELGLGRTANLVMVPVQNYTEAYAASEASLPVRGLYAGYNLVTGAVGTVAGVLGSFLGIGPGQPTPQQSTSSDRSVPIPDSAPSSEGTGVGRRNIRTVRSNNIRTLHDQQPGQRDQQFYNGNQLNFEPRNPDDHD